MDQSMAFKAPLFAEGDHAPLIAAAAVAQASTRTAVLAERMRRRRAPFQSPLAALATIFVGGDAEAAAVSLQGSFQPRLAGVLANRRPGQSPANQ